MLQYLPPQIAYATREIASTRVSGSVAASITFSSIPATYKHLLILLSGQCDNAAEQNLLMRFNGDTGANYHWQLMQGSGATAAASSSASQTAIIPGSVLGSAHTNRAGSSYIFIPEYTGTTWHKNSLSQGGRIKNDTANDFIFQTFFGHWKSTAAITSITLLPATGNFQIGSIATLYGLI